MFSSSYLWSTTVQACVIWNIGRAPSLDVSSMPIEQPANISSQTKIMIETIAKWTVILFGVFFICIGLLMLIKPKKAREILRKAGSTNFINYAEITIRIIPAVGLILSADNSRFPDIFKVFGWFMLLTSFVLYFVPRQLHHKFSMKAADVLKPVNFQIISPFAFLLGALLIYCVI